VLDPFERRNAAGRVQGEDVAHEGEKTDQSVFSREPARLKPLLEEVAKGRHSVGTETRRSLGIWLPPSEGGAGGSGEMALTHSIRRWGVLWQIAGT
jgi:hypothetical protein